MWAAPEPGGAARHEPPLSPDSDVPPLPSPAGLQAALLAQLTAQHVSQLQYQQALLAWARLVAGGLAVRPPDLLPAPLGSALAGGGGCSPSAGSGSPPPRSDGSPPVRTARKAAARAKIFACPVCGRGFGYKHVLQNHVRTHTGEKPFQCPECQKRFTRDHHLKTHMRLHTGEKPYQCVHCERRFVQVANLRRHLRVHTGERPYPCRHCSARFSDSNQLRTHELVHTGHKPYRCAAGCGAEFRRRQQLALHRCAMPVPLPVPMMAEEAPRLHRALRDGHRAAAGGLSAELAALTALKTESGSDVDVKLLKTEPEIKIEVKLEPGMAGGLMFTPGMALGRAPLPDIPGQTEPEDLSVTAPRRPSASSLASPPSVSGGRPESAERMPHLRWPSGAEETADALQRGPGGGEFVPWWDMRRRHGSGSGSEGSRRLSVSSQDHHTTGWAVHGDRQKSRVIVSPERHRQPSGAGWPARSTGHGLRSSASPGHQSVEVRQPDGPSWPWNLTLTAAGRRLPETEQRSAVSSPEVTELEPPEVSKLETPEVVELEPHSSDGEGEQYGPARAAAVGRHRTEETAPPGRDRRAPPPLVPLWIPPLSSDAPRPAQEDAGRTKQREEDSALLQLLTAPASPPAAERHRDRGYEYSGVAQHGGTAQEPEELRRERHSGEAADTDRGWTGSEEEHHTGARYRTYRGKDGVDIQPWESVKG